MHAERHFAGAQNWKNPAKGFSLFKVRISDADSDVVCVLTVVSRSSRQLASRLLVTLLCLVAPMNRNQLPGGRREQVIEYSYPGRVEGQETKAMKQRRKLFDELMEGIDAMQQRRKGKTHPALE